MTASTPDDAEALNGSASGSPEPAERPAHREPPSILGFHHVRVPVSDVLRSRDWYVDVFGFEPVLDYEEEDRLTGVVLNLPGGETIHLHDQPQFAAALSGFAFLALSVPDLPDLQIWSDHLQALGISHSEIIQGHSGWFVHVSDPDGLLVQIHTRGQPTAD